MSSDEAGTPPAPPVVRPWAVWANATMVLLLVVAAVVQYNDPDPVLWMGVYLGAAALSLVIPRHRWAVRPAWAFAGIATVWAVALAWSGVEAGGLQAALAGEGMETAGVEELREAGGLFIASAWLVSLIWIRNRPPEVTAS